MALHTYTPTEWKNAPDYKTTPINATNLNNIETGIENAYTDIAEVNSFDPSGTDLVSITKEDAIKEVNDKTKHGIVELWKNSDISTAFAGQAVSVDYDETIYDGVILTMQSLPSEARGAEWFEFDNDIISSFTTKSFLTVESGVNPPRIVHYGRSITGMSISGGKLTITFSDGTLTTNNFSTNSSSSTTNNGLQVPVRILGLIHNN